MIGHHDRLKGDREIGNCVLNFVVQLILITVMLLCTSIEEDFDNTTVEFSITGTGSVTAPVPIIDDFTLEEVESFSANLAAGSGAGVYFNIVFDPILASANIIDNDGNGR